MAQGKSNAMIRHYDDEKVAINRHYDDEKVAINRHYDDELLHLCTN